MEKKWILTKNTSSNSLLVSQNSQRQVRVLILVGVGFVERARNLTKRVRVSTPRETHSTTSVFAKTATNGVRWRMSSRSWNLSYTRCIWKRWGMRTNLHLFGMTITADRKQSECIVLSQLHILLRIWGIIPKSGKRGFGRHTNPLLLEIELQV